MKTKTKTALILLMLMCIGMPCLHAQGMKKKQTLNPDSIIPLKHRLAFRTNVIDWAAMLPNVAVEFDLAPKLLSNNPWTVGVSAKGNWTTPSVLPNDFFYDITTVRLEFKHYNRTKNFPQGTEKTWLKRILTWYKEKPSLTRTWFIGPYADFTKYNLKFSSTGHKGIAFGGGVTFGYGRSLYKFKHGVLDLEASASLGLLYTQYDSYTLSRERNSYEYKEKDVAKFVPYPVISDIRLGFVYRFNSGNSIKDKYKNSSTFKDRVEAIKRSFKARRDSIQDKRRAKHIADSIAYAAAHPEEALATQAEADKTLQSDTTANDKAAKKAKRAGKRKGGGLLGKRGKDKAAADTTATATTPTPTTNDDAATDTTGMTPAMPTPMPADPTPQDSLSEQQDTTQADKPKKKDKKSKKKRGKSKNADGKEPETGGDTTTATPATDNGDQPVTVPDSTGTAATPTDGEVTDEADGKDKAKDKKSKRAKKPKRQKADSDKPDETTQDTPTEETTE